MTIQFTPEDFTIQEFEEFTLSVVCEDVTDGGPPVGDPPEAPPPTTTTLDIDSVTCADSGITITFDQNIFTIEPTSAFVEAFSRNVKYLDGDNTSIAVDSFDALPTEFNAVYSYTAPAEYSVVQPVHVTFVNTTTADFLITVTVNWARANTELVHQVNLGKF